MSIYLSICLSTSVIHMHTYFILHEHTFLYVFTLCCLYVYVIHINNINNINKTELTLLQGPFGTDPIYDSANSYGTSI